jgi:hypothetical protein
MIAFGQTSKFGASAQNRSTTEATLSLSAG